MSRPTTKIKEAIKTANELLTTKQITEDQFVAKVMELEIDPKAEMFARNFLKKMKNV